MKTKTQTFLVALALAAALVSPLSTVLAQDSVLTYQGRVQSSGTNFTGPGQFKFALVTVTNEASQATAVATISGGFLTIITPVEVGSGYVSAPTVTITGGGGSGAAATANVSGGSVVSYTVNDTGSGYTSIPTVTVAAPPPNLHYTTYWSNDGASTVGSEPAQAVGVQVQNGLFTVRLGDPALPNMQQFPTGLFKQPDLQMRTWFNDGIHGFGVIEPTHRLTAVAYAFTANHASSANGITGTIDADQITGTIKTNQLAPNAVTSQKIADGTIIPADLSPFVLNNIFWRLGGNSGTTGGQDFIGTTDDTPLDLRVNNLRVLRLEYNNGDSTEDDDSTTDEAPNIIGGSKWNRVGAGVVGATIAGGGATNGVYGPYPPLVLDAYASGRSNAIYANFGSIGGGYRNLILEDSGASTIGGGRRNDIKSSSYAVIGGGAYNSIENSSPGVFVGYLTGGGAAIGGGTGHHIADSVGGTIAGGHANEIAAAYGSIGGGEENNVTAAYATVGGGYYNDASGQHATIPGGKFNEASGDHSFAAGYQAKAVHQGAFVWADSTEADAESSTNNSVTMRASGGYRLFSSADTTAPAPGVYLAAGDSAWGTISDRNAKKNIQPLDPRAVLEKLAQVPVPQWNYKSESDDAVPHIGPMAQDFKATFYPGRDDKSITTLEFDGVALAAIQGLNQKLTTELEQKQMEITELKQRLEKLERLVIQQDGGAR